MSGSSSLGHRPDIDGLRAIAVLAVVAYHATKRISGGFVGVDVFFVISGFLISGIIISGLERGSFSLTEFYVRRIRRIFPALLLVLVSSWMLGWMVLEPQAYALLGQHMVAGAAFASNILLWSEFGYFDPAAAFKPLLHLWSLGIEEQFYLVWPLMLIFATTRKWPALFPICILLSASFLVNIAGVQNNPVGTFYLPFSRFWELLGGGLLAYLHLHYRDELDARLSFVICQVGRFSVSLRSVASVSGFLLVALSIYAIDETSRFPGWWALLPTTGAMLLIAVGSNGIINRTLLASKWMVYIGLISYPLYLCHWPLLTFGRMTSIGMDHPRLITLSMVALAFVLSVLTYQFVEKPLRYGYRCQAKAVARGLLGAMVLSAALGALTYFQHGWISRYPQAVRPFLDYHFDYRESFRNHRCLLAGTERDFASECTPAITGAPVMLIWGDSHGAMLYRALSEAAISEGVSVAQFTSSSCPPILNFDKKDRPLCRQINDDIFKKISELKPKIVVLAHDWPQSVPENSLEKFPDTFRKLRAAGVRQIIVVGPVPHWGKNLPAEVVRYMQSKDTPLVPERLVMPAMQGDSVRAIDRDLLSLSKSESVSYVQSLEVFCENESCLVKLDGNGGGDLTAFDDAHLTQIAAYFLVAKNKKLFFP